MADRTLSLDNPLWEFALTLYGREGVQQLLIGWQDSAGVNINIVLFMLWLGSQKRRLDAVHLPLIASAIEPLHQDLVEPLRQLRRHAALKANEYGDSGLTVKDKVLAAELQAEKLVIAALYGLSQSQAFSNSSAFNQLSHSTVATLQTHNLSSYLKQFPSLATENIEQLLNHI